MERLRTKELLVDIFGAFIPGFAFILLALSMLGLTANLLYEVVSSLHDDRASLANWNETGKAIVTNNAAAFLVIVFVMVLSYLIGVLAMRCPVRRVDRISWWRMYGRGLASAGINEEQLENLMCAAAPKSWPDEALKAAHGHNSKDHIDETAEKLADLYHGPARTHKECYFPYTNLKDSLSSKKLGELAKMVPWSTEDKKTHASCTVEFVDLMKLRIRTYFPAAFVELAKQEASVRILSSAWYLARSLSWLALILGLVVVSLSAIQFYVFFHRVTEPDLKWKHGFPIATIAIVLIGVWVARFTAKRRFKPRGPDRPFVDEYNMYVKVMLITTTLLVLFCGISCSYFYSINYSIVVQKLAEIAVIGFHCGVLVILVGFGGQAAQIRIEKEFHRLRRRELVNTLQVAWLTFRHQPGLLRDLIPNWQPSETEVFRSPIDATSSPLNRSETTD